MADWINTYIDQRETDQNEKSSAFVLEYAKELETFESQEIQCSCCYHSMGVVFTTKTDNINENKRLFICQECQDGLVKIMPHCDCCTGRGCGACPLCYGENATHEPLACKYRRPKFVSN